MSWVDGSVVAAQRISASFLGDRIFVAQPSPVCRTPLPHHQIYQDLVSHARHPTREVPYTVYVQVSTPQATASDSFSAQHPYYAAPPFRYCGSRSLVTTNRQGFSNRIRTHRRGLVANRHRDRSTNAWNMAPSQLLTGFFETRRGKP